MGGYFISFSGLIANIKKLTLENRTLFYMCILAFFLSLASIIENIIIDFPFDGNYKWFVLMCLSVILMHFIYRNKYIKHIKLITFCVLIFLVLPLGALSGGVFNNLAIPYSCLILISVAYFFTGFLRIFLIIGDLIITVGAFVIVVYYPEFYLQPEKNILQIDLLLQIPIILITVAVMISTFSKAYSNEREKLKKFADIIEKKNKELEKLSNTDMLTGLPNRRYIFNNLKEYISKENENIIVGMIDVDNFKIVNDKYGHDVGDEVLKKVGVGLFHIIDNHGVIGRYGGDEFITILHFYNLNDVYEIIEKLKNFKIEYLENKQSVYISSGFCLFNKDKQFDETIACADKLLYHVKSHGKNNSIISLEK